MGIDADGGCLLPEAVWRTAARSKEKRWRMTGPRIVVYRGLDSLSLSETHYLLTPGRVETSLYRPAALKEYKERKVPGNFDQMGFAPSGNFENYIIQAQRPVASHHSSVLSSSPALLHPLPLSLSLFSLP